MMRNLSGVIEYQKCKMHSPLTNVQVFGILRFREKNLYPTIHVYHICMFIRLLEAILPNNEELKSFYARPWVK